VRNGHDYFKENYDRYNEFIRFVFESNLTGDEITLLQSINRPQLEFNILESRISRLLGEFSKQEPDIYVTADDETKADWLTMKVGDSLETYSKIFGTRPEHYRTAGQYKVNRIVAGADSASLYLTGKLGTQRLNYLADVLHQPYYPISYPDYQPSRDSIQLSVRYPTGQPALTSASIMANTMPNAGDTSYFVAYMPIGGFEKSAVTNTFTRTYYAFRGQIKRGNLTVFDLESEGYGTITLTQGPGWGGSYWYSIGAGGQQEYIHPVLCLAADGLPLPCQSSDVLTASRPTAPTKAPRIYPNPASDFVHLEELPTGAKVAYKVISLTGAVILNGVIKNAETIAVSQLRNGIYLLELDFEDRIVRLQMAVSN
jgi:hypothetical protein